MELGQNLRRQVGAVVKSPGDSTIGLSVGSAPLGGLSRHGCLLHPRGLMCWEGQEAGSGLPGKGVLWDVPQVTQWVPHACSSLGLQLEAHVCIWGRLGPVGKKPALRADFLRHCPRSGTGQTLCAQEGTARAHVQVRKLRHR